MGRDVENPAIDRFLISIGAASRKQLTRKKLSRWKSADWIRKIMGRRAG